MKNDSLSKDFYKHLFTFVKLFFTKDKCYSASNKAENHRQKIHREWKAQRHMTSAGRARESKSGNCARVLSALGHRRGFSQEHEYTRCLRRYWSSWKKHVRHKQPNTSMQAAHRIIGSTKARKVLGDDRSIKWESKAIDRIFKMQKVFSWCLKTDRHEKWRILNLISGPAKHIWFTKSSDLRSISCEWESS